MKNVFFFGLLGLCFYSLSHRPLEAAPQPSQESRCYGSVSNGALRNGVRLPIEGRNFFPYHSFGIENGRTYVHSKVKEIIEASYDELFDLNPDRKYMYAETGKKNGGDFWPHKTHQNGLSVDLMVPIVDETGESVLLETNEDNLYGYEYEFDNEGRLNNLRIDWQSMVDQLWSLYKTAKKAGVGIAKVIFDPVLQPYLETAEGGKEIRKRLKFTKKRVWVRHDEHFHIDFAIPCAPLMTQSFSKSF